METLFEDIRPGKLGSLSHAKYVKEISAIALKLIKQDIRNMLLLVEYVKSCDASYKRDMLIEVLNDIIYSSDSIIDIILEYEDAFKSIWKDMANCLVATPDLVANCYMLDKFEKFKPDVFYETLLKKLLQTCKKNYSNLSSYQKKFFLLLLGRIAISGSSQLVWTVFTQHIIDDSDEDFKNTMAEIFTIPLDSSQFEIFIESLYMPIFFNLQPSQNSGKKIKSLLNEKILKNELFEYILCNKAVLQTNYQHRKQGQKAILFNVISYLSHLSDVEQTKDPSLLMRTSIKIAESWSNKTKILFRTYEHNRYISYAFVIAFRYVLERDKKSFMNHVIDIQSKIMQGFTVYLERASFELRNLAMCIGELVLPKLHEFVHFQNKDSCDLKFQIEWNDDCLEIRSLLSSDLEEIFIDRPPVDRPKIEVAQKSPTTDEDEYEEFEEDASNVPIYLRDCINGLVDYNNPRYVRLCLIKAGELIEKLSQQEAKQTTADKYRLSIKSRTEKPKVSDAIGDIAIELAQLLLHLDNQYNIEDFDAHRLKAMVSLVVATPLLVAKYLLEQFNGDNRNLRHQLDILQILVGSAQIISSPDHKKASSPTSSKKKETTNEFARYGPLFFYGLTHRLQQRIGPAAISVTERRWIDDDLDRETSEDSLGKLKNIGRESEKRLEDSYLLSRILFSISLIIKCLNQQPISCKLSNDLLDTLAAYRLDPDAGVQKAIVSCLTVVRDCTPSAYFQEFLKDKLVHLFGPFLSNEFDKLTTNDSLAIYRR